LKINRVQSPTSNSYTKQLSLEQITPELAAQIIKHYVIPMFDQDSIRKNRKGTIVSELKLTETLF